MSAGYFFACGGRQTFPDALASVRRIITGLALWKNMTEITSSPRPADTVQLAAVRLLCVVCHFGEEGGAAEGGPVVWGERHLQELDHLLRHPDQQALLTLDRLAASNEPPPSNLADNVRHLLREDGAAPRRLEIPPWRSIDDALAFLTCRNLLHLTSRPQGGQTERGFVATEDGVSTLASLSAKEGMPRRLRERCRWLRQLIAPGDALDLDGARQRLDAFMQHENLAVEDDPTPRRFHALFDQRL